MTLNLGWLNRLHATESAIRAAAEEIERVAVRGLPSAGSIAAPMTPLSPAQWQPLQDGLTDIELEMQSLMQSVAPEEVRGVPDRQPFAAARYQIAVALLMLEEQVIDDLDPARVKGFGKLEEPDRERLADSVARLRARVRSMLTYVEGLSG